MPSGRLKIMKPFVKKEEGDEHAEDAGAGRQVIRRRLDQEGTVAADEMRLVRAQADAEAIQSMEQIRVVEEELLQAKAEIVELKAEITQNRTAITAKDEELRLLRADLARVTSGSAAREPGPPPPAAGADASASAVSFFQEGNRLYGEKRYFDAAQSWKNATVLGHNASHAFLSDMLFDGRPGLPQNLQQSFQLAQAGAALGCIHSKAILGLFYIAGKFVARNEKKGKALVIKSSEAGSRFGLYCAGLCLLAINHLESAVLMFRQAAEQGHAAAQDKLGTMYESGRGCVQDYALALRQFRSASEQGLASAHVNMGSMFEEGQGVAQDYAEAARLYRLAADQGHLGGQFMLGLMFKRGLGVGQNDAEAVRLLRLAAAQTSEADAEFAQMFLDMWRNDGLMQ